MPKGRAIQINDKGLKPLREPESTIKPPEADLPDLEAELREHLARRPPNSEPQAIAAWVTEKERLQFWITLARTAATPPKFERVELPPAPKTTISTEHPMPKNPASRSAEELLDDKVAEIQNAQAELTGLPTRKEFLGHRQRICQKRWMANKFAKDNGLETPVFPPMPPNPWVVGKAGKKAAKPGEEWTSSKGSRPRSRQVAPPQQMRVDDSSGETERLAQAGLERPYEAAIDLGRAIERHHAAGGRDLEALLLQLQHLQVQVLGITAQAVQLSAEDRVMVLEPAANLDALAHQLAQFLATGRIEVAA